MEPSIFPMFYSFHRAYTKTFTIFGSVHNFLHKFKHQSLLILKEKEKQHCCCGRPAHARPRPAHALGPRAARALPLLTMSLTAGPHCQLRLPLDRRLGRVFGRR